jgi:hypothetical protein
VLFAKFKSWVSTVSSQLDLCLDVQIFCAEDKKC